jgi:hypothetical protein
MNKFEKLAALELADRAIERATHEYRFVSGLHAMYEKPFREKRRALLAAYDKRYEQIMTRTIVGKR